MSNAYFSVSVTVVEVRWIKVMAVIDDSGLVNAAVALTGTMTKRSWGRSIAVKSNIREVLYTKLR